MKILKKFGTNISYILFAFVSLSFLAYLIGGQIVLKSQYGMLLSQVTDFSEDWTIIYGIDSPNAEKDTISLPSLISSGDAGTIILRKTLPDSLVNTNLMIWNMGHELQVFIDGASRMKVDTEGISFVSTKVPFQYDFVYLTESDAGAEIEIHLITPFSENSEFGSVYLGDTASLLLEALSDKIPGFVFAIFLIILGITTTIVAIVVQFHSGYARQMVFLGPSVSLTALWFLLNSPETQFIFPNISTARECAFFAAALIPMPLIFFVDVLQNKRYRLILSVLGLLLFINYVYTLIAFCIFKRSLNSVFASTAILSLISIVVLFGLIIRDIIKKEIRSYWMYAVGIMGFALSAAIYVVLYSLMPFKGDSGIFLMCGLTFLFAVSVIEAFSNLKAFYTERINMENTISQLSSQAMESLARTVDAKDKYTNGHSYRVAIYSSILAKGVGLSQEEIELIRSEALLHDIGKIGVPDSVLNKPGRLDDMEFTIMKSHSPIGADILKDMKQLPLASIVAGQHHERYDGKGYPAGLSGENIHFHARIVGIADAYDAMSSDRIYRKALPKEVIREELVKGRGSQFDPLLLDIFLHLFDADMFKISSQDDHFKSEEIELMEEINSDFNEFFEKHCSSNNDTPTGALSVDIKEFDKLYDFTRHLTKRYNQEFRMIIISISPSLPTPVTREDLSLCEKAMDVAIRKNVRSVDIYLKYNSLQHIVILTNPGEGNIEIIMQRIFLDYLKIDDSKKFSLSYKIEEDK